MADFNSKYTGQQVEALLDIVAEGGNGGGGEGEVQKTTETEILAMGFTKNEGTITEVKMNGVSKGTSGVVDLGTVITDVSDKQDAIPDLSAIREGASKGATALQSIPSEYVTEDDLMWIKAEGESGVRLKGTNGTATGNLAISAGDDKTASDGTPFTSAASGDHAVVFGFGNTCAGRSTLAQGLYNTVNGKDAVAFGQRNLVNGDQAFAVGQQNEVTARLGVAIGYKNKATNTDSIAIGYQNTSGGSASVAMGDTCEANGTSSTAMGYKTKATGAYSSTFGENTQATNNGEVAMGSFNKSTTSNDASEQTSFSFGIGTSDTNRANAFEIKKNGDVYIGDNLLQPDKYVTEEELEDKGYAEAIDLDGKVDKETGKGLSTEDFTAALKAKLEGLSNYDDTAISDAVDSLQSQIDTLVGGNATEAIDSFNEIVAFLDGVTNSEDLDSIIASIEQQIASKQDKIEGLDEINAKLEVIDGIVDEDGYLYSNGEKVDMRFTRSLLPVGTAIPANANLNTIQYLKIGKYYCSLNVDAETITNCPVKVAFSMEVFNPLGTNVDDETTREYTYRIRVLTDYKKGMQYIQYCATSGTPGQWSYNSWSVVPQTAFALASNKHGGSAAKGTTSRGVYIDANGVFQQMGYTIQKSVPSNAVFTDTNTKVTSVGNHYTPAEDTSVAINAPEGEFVVGLKRDAAGHVVGIETLPSEGNGVPIVPTIADLDSDAEVGSLAVVAQEGIVKDSFRDMYQVDLENDLDAETGVLIDPTKFDAVTELRVKIPTEPIEEYVSVTLVPRDFNSNSSSMALLIVSNEICYVNTETDGAFTICEMRDGEWVAGDYEDKLAEFNSILASNEWVYIGRTDSYDAPTDAQFDALDSVFSVVGGNPTFADLYIKRNTWERVDGTESGGGGLPDMSGYVTDSELSEALESKQNAITDLDDIRSGASAGATALQSIPSEYITEEELNAQLEEKVDKVSGKQLSTEDFTSALKTKLESLVNYDDAEISDAVSSLQAQVNTLVSGNASDAINSFNEIIAFLDGIKDTQDLSSIIASIEQQIATKMDNVTLSTVATSGSYNDLTNKPSIPSAVTESTVSGWGFTKNTGTYSKPSTGIPATDLATAVQTSLGKADTALQSYTEQYKGTITGVSANGTSIATSGVANIPAASTSAYGVTKLSNSTSSTSTTLAATASAVKAAYDLANSYKGTVTGVKVNGTTKSPSSGTVDIGNIVTSVKVNGTTYSPTSGVVDLGTISGGSGGGTEEKYVTLAPPVSFGIIQFGSELGAAAMKPNVIYIPDVSDKIEGLWIGEFEDTDESYAIYTVIFKTVEDMDGGGFTFSIPAYVKWANGEPPTLELDTMYELSISRVRMNWGDEYNAILIPFKSV